MEAWVWVSTQNGCKKNRKCPEPVGLRATPQTGPAQGLPSFLNRSLGHTSKKAHTPGQCVAALPPTVPARHAPQVRGQPGAAAARRQALPSRHLVRDGPRPTGHPGGSPTSDALARVLLRATVRSCPTRFFADILTIILCFLLLCVCFVYTVLFLSYVC